LDTFFSEANKLPGVKSEIIKKVLRIICTLWNVPYEVANIAKCKLKQQTLEKSDQK